MNTELNLPLDNVDDDMKVVLQKLSEWVIYYPSPKETRAKQSRPYSYDSLTIWKSGITPKDSVYSDRLMQWDFKKHDELCLKHFGDKGQYWNKRSPELIEKFLQDYLETPSLVLCEILVGCNQSNGYPYWCFRFRSDSHP